jgi:hypothetical protein
MLYGRRLDQALEHVDGSRYALVHAVAKRARQITLWLTADPAELRAEAAPPPAAGELVTRDPVALAEAEILAGEVLVRWDPHGAAEAPEEIATVDDLDETLLLESLSDDDDDADLGPEEEGEITPALAQVLEGEAAEADEEEDEEAEEEPEEVATTGDDIVDVSLDELAEAEADDDEDEVPA